MSLSDKLMQVAEWEPKDARSDGTTTFLKKKVAETINYIDKLFTDSSNNELISSNN